MCCFLCVWIFSFSWLLFDCEVLVASAYRIVPVFFSLFHYKASAQTAMVKSQVKKCPECKDSVLYRCFYNYAQCFSVLGECVFQFHSFFVEELCFSVGDCHQQKVQVVNSSYFFLLSYCCLPSITFISLINRTNSNSVILSRSF